MCGREERKSSSRRTKAPMVGWGRRWNARRLGFLTAPADEGRERERERERDGGGEGGWVRKKEEEKNEEEKNKGEE